MLRTVKALIEVGEAVRGLLEPVVLVPFSISQSSRSQRSPAVILAEVDRDNLILCHPYSDDATAALAFSVSAPTQSQRASRTSRSRSVSWQSTFSEGGES